jgi:hypothetical protein
MAQIAHSVAEVRSSANIFVGTAFFTAPSELITCLHVAEAAAPGARISWLGETRTVVDIQASEVDAARVELSSPFGILAPQVLPWSFSTIEPDTEVSICGFNDPHLYSLEHLSRRLRGWAQHHDLYVLDQPVPGGFSGSPARVADEVVGVVVAADRERTLLIPTSTIRSLQPPPPPALDDLLFDLGAVRTEVSPGGRSPFVEFTLTNRGTERIKVTGISLHVTSCDRLPRPHHAHPEGLPEQFELHADLRPDENEYELLDAHHVLEAGETEGYRLRLTSPEGWEYSYRLSVQWKPLGEDRINTYDHGPFRVRFPVQSVDGMLGLLELPPVRDDPR